jgi:hypothetical protein
MQDHLRTEALGPVTESLNMGPALSQCIAGQDVLSQDALDQAGSSCRMESFLSAVKWISKETADDRVFFFFFFFFVFAHRRQLWLGIGCFDVG